MIDRESANAWFGHLFVSLGASREVNVPGRPRVWHPPTDVYETDAEIMVKIEVAGVNEESFDVSLDGRALIVSGRRDDPAAKLSYHQMEINYGEFRSDVYLPCEVDETNIRADYDNGFLYILLPKVRREHKIPVVVVIEQ